MYVINKEQYALKLNRVKTIDVEHKKGNTPVVIIKLDNNNYYGVVLFQASHLNQPVRDISPDIEYIYSNTAGGAEKESIDWIKRNIGEIEKTNEICDKKT